MTLLRTVASRRTFLLGAGTLVLASACARQPGIAPSADARTIAFRHGDIETTVPANPQRVAVIEGRGDLEFALLAGYPIIATGGGEQQSKQTLPADQYAGRLDPTKVEVLKGGDKEVDLEQLAALRPDLIVMRANGWRRDWYGNDLVSAIAPVLPVEVNRPDFRSDLTAQLTLLGRANAVAPALAEYDAKVTAARAELARLVPDATVALMTTQMIGTGSVRLWTNQLGTAIARDLGLDVLGHDPADDDGELELAVEEIGRVREADLIFHQNSEPSSMASVATWRRLPAVAADRAFSYPRAYNNGLVITASAVVDLILASARGVAG